MRIFVRHERLRELCNGSLLYPFDYDVIYLFCTSIHVCFRIIGILSEKQCLTEVLLFTHMSEQLKENKDERKGS